MADRTPRRRLVRSRLAMVAVVERADLEAAVAGAPLAAEEAMLLSSRHPQSLAGTLAAKEAVAALLADLLPGEAVSPGSVIISHDADGAPHVSSVPCMAGHCPRLLVSISHTGTTAIALAVAEVDAEAGH